MSNANNGAIKIQIPSAIRYSGMASLRQWIMCYAPVGNKKPMQLHDVEGEGRFASTNKPETWSNLDEIVAACNKINFAAGGFVVCPGFVLTDNDPIICFDIDHKNEPDAEERKKQKAFAAHFMDSYAEGNMYVETSVSGKGTHAFARCETTSCDYTGDDDDYLVSFGLDTLVGIDDGHDDDFRNFLGNKSVAGQHLFGLEIYASGQYIALTFGYYNEAVGPQHDVMRSGKYYGSCVPRMSRRNQDELYLLLLSGGHHEGSTGGKTGEVSKPPAEYAEVRNLMDSPDMIRLAKNLVKKQHTDFNVVGSNKHKQTQSLQDDLADPKHPFRTPNPKTKKLDFSHTEWCLLKRITARAGYFRKDHFKTAMAKTLIVMQEWCFFDSRIGETDKWSKPFENGPQVRTKESDREQYLQYLFRVANVIFAKKKVKPALPTPFTPASGPKAPN